MLEARIVAGLVLAPLGIAAILLLPHPSFALLAAAIFAGGAWEWSQLAGIDGVPARVAYTALVTVSIAGLWWLGSQQLAVAAILAGGVIWLLAGLWLTRFRTGQSAQGATRWVKAAFGWFILVGCFAAIVALHGLPGNGPRWALAVLATVWITDTAAYFSGRAFGRRKLAPRISPNKTWAGAVGAFCAAMLFIGGALYVLAGDAVSAWAVILLGLATTAFAMIGDLFVSLLKRHRGIKDTGRLIPGHGGILDRFDSVLAAVPVFVLTKRALGI